MTIEGLYRARPDADTLVVVVHGLGGHADSAYMVDAAIAIEDAGHACLRLCLRGSQGSGQDIYHAGLIADVRAALAHPDFADYERVWLVGYSLGGHVALRAGVEGIGDARLGAVAAVCPPLDLGAVQAWLDAPARKIYREYILRELRSMYRAVAQRGRAPTPIERVEQVRTLREWDALTVVPRFGFSGPDDYYRQMSVGPHLDRLQVPALLVASRHDPMIPAASIARAAEPAAELLELCWIDQGGHVFFPTLLDAGLSSEPGLMGQTLGWLAARDENP